MCVRVIFVELSLFEFLIIKINVHLSGLKEFLGGALILVGELKADD